MDIYHNHTFRNKCEMQVNNLRMRNQRENSYEIDLVQEETKK